MVCVDGTSNQFSKNVRRGCLQHTFRDAHHILEHKCSRAVRPPDQGQEATDVLHERDRDIRPTVVVLAALCEAGRRTRHRSRHSLVCATGLLTTEALNNFCRRFERIVLDAYLWLTENYVDGDRIYLFGTSVVVPRYYS